MSFPPVRAIYATGNIVWCKGVSTTGGSFTSGTFTFGGGCVGPVSSAAFSPTDGAAFITVQLADIVIGTTYEFYTQWRDPMNNLCNECAHDSGPVYFNVNAISLGDSIQIAGRLPATTPGTWSVEVLVSPGGVSPISLTTSSFTVGPTAPTVTTYSVTFSVSPGDAGSNAGLSVDGQAASSGRQFTWKQGEQHSVSVNKVAAGSDSGTRYVFTGWSDGVSDASRTVTVNNNMVLVANYKTQHMLTVNSDHGSPSGGDWYDEGAKATATLDTGLVSDNLFYDWVFTGWRGDATGSNLQSNPISMDSAKTATAAWDHRLSTAFYAIIGVVVVAAAAVAVFLMRGRGGTKKKKS